MAVPTGPNVTIEDLLKIIGDKEVQLMTKTSYIKAMADKIMELEEQQRTQKELKKASE